MKDEHASRKQCACITRVTANFSVVALKWFIFATTSSNLTVCCWLTRKLVRGQATVCHGKDALLLKQLAILHVGQSSATRTVCNGRLGAIARPTTKRVATASSALVGIAAAAALAIVHSHFWRSRPSRRRRRLGIGAELASSIWPAIRLVVTGTLALQRSCLLAISSIEALIQLAHQIQLLLVASLRRRLLNWRLLVAFNSRLTLTLVGLIAVLFPSPCSAVVLVTIHLGTLLAAPARLTAARLALAGSRWGLNHSWRGRSGSSLAAGHSGQ